MAVIPYEQLLLERDHYRILVEVTNTILSTLDIEDLAFRVSESIHGFFGVDYIGLDLFTSESGDVRSLSMLYPAVGSASKADAEWPVAAALIARGQLTYGVAQYTRSDLERRADDCVLAQRLLTEGLTCVRFLPLISGQKILGALCLAGYRDDLFSADPLGLLVQIAARIAIAVDNAMAYSEISRLKDRLTSENQALSEEIGHYQNFGEIIGQSMAMASVLEQVEMVAGSDCTVLILGETGTGKELIARAIHKLSPRREQRMVTMNCAAIPTGLLESDLFGHEKGAFTGASNQRLGRFELANHSTLFLDEVGDIPLELQPKLLRVLQEREIERLGGQKVIPVDVRVIAATSCDLKQMMADRQYRSDLYYRLNVFPIVVPPLRDRPEDIPVLARFFTQRIARQMNRQIDTIDSETFVRLLKHPWPGNVRELENVIERAVILTRGRVLNLPLSDLQYEPPQVTAPSVPVATPVAQAGEGAVESERQKIIRILRETNGVVAGTRGAAARLGLKRTTLLSRMQRYGISVKTIQDEADSAASE